jgi:hypothetical protein
MDKETLRMQMLAGIITEGQYKKEVEEIDSNGIDWKDNEVDVYYDEDDDDETTSYTTEADSRIEKQGDKYAVIWDETIRRKTFWSEEKAKNFVNKSKRIKNSKIQKYGRGAWVVSYFNKPKSKLFPTLSQAESFQIDLGDYTD